MFKKIFWILFFFLFGFNLQSSTVFASDTKILIHGISETQRDYRYLLRTDNHSYSSVILDCQSFVNGLEFYRSNNQAPSESFFLYHNECEDIFFFIQDSEDLGQKTCLTLNTWERTYNLSTKLESCI